MLAARQQFQLGWGGAHWMDPVVDTDDGGNSTSFWSTSSESGRSGVATAVIWASSTGVTPTFN